MCVNRWKMLALIRHEQTDHVIIVVLTYVTNAVTLGPPAVSHMASFPVPVEYKIVRNVQSVRTYVTELAQSNTPKQWSIHVYDAVASQKYV